MVYTVTFNPALDYNISVNDFIIGETNRTASEDVFAGGKGINVSIVLRNLGIDTTILGFIAGFTGNEIQNRLHQQGCRTDLIKVEAGMSRINVKLENKNIQTEINGQGPNISASDIDKLMGQLEHLTSEDTLILAGSIPKGVSASIYKDIINHIKDKNVTVIVDATGSLLLNSLESHPFLIKPNTAELGEIFGVKLSCDKNEIIMYAKKLQDMGARNVIVSMACNGAVLLTENGQIYKSDAPKGRVINAVGAGDSMVAGFLSGWLQKKDYLYAFKMGISAGSASAFSEFLATKTEIENVYLCLK